jgi:hypothetical protein
MCFSKPSMPVQSAPIVDQAKIDADAADGCETRGVSPRGAACASPPHALLEVAQEPPEHLALPRVDTLERIPWTRRPLHLGQHQQRPVGTEREEIGLVAAVARAAPVPTDHPHAERAEEPFRRALSWVARHARQGEPEPVDEIGERDAKPIGAKRAPHGREARA